jgi:hypothetical protein
MMDPILEEIKAATHWHLVEKIDDAYVISFAFKDHRQIIGLARGEQQDSFYLNFDSLRQVPISFLISFGESSIVQYWTLNQQLHRTGSRPALTSVMRDDVGGDHIVCRRWFWNGMPHRVDGPAIEKMTGYNAAVDNQSYLTESWSSKQLIWMVEGQEARYPFPKKAELLDGSSIKYAKTKEYCKFEDVPSLHAAIATFEWELPRYKEDWNHHLIPLHADISDFSEFYEQGKLKNRQCERLEMDWLWKGKKLAGLFDMNEFHEALLNTGLIRKLDFWKAPFYSTAGTEVMMLTEFEKWGGADELND